MENFRYVGEECPICKTQFTGTEDIVVCPLCGTPHHKECYKKNGECGNSDRHSEGYVWTEQAKPEPEQEPSAEYPQNEYAPPVNNPFYAAQPEGSVPYIQMQNPLDAFPPELEENVPTLDTAAYVKRNVANYLRKFFTEKSGKRTFNLGAFFFGAYWFFYRKMYKLGAIFIAITIFLSVTPYFVPQYYHLNNDLLTVTEKYKKIDTSSDEALAQINEMNVEISDLIKKYPVGTAIEVLRYLADIALAFYFGFTANKKYAKHVAEKVKKINASAQTDELRRWRITDEGGCSFTAVALAFSATFVLNSVLIRVAELIIR